MKDFFEKENRPWGTYIVLSEDKSFKIKKIEVNPKSRLSYQYHNKRSEVWTIVDGFATVTIESEVRELSYGDTILISQGTRHRIENKGSKKLVFIEIQTGSYFGEDDIVRIEDDYNRL